MLDIAGHLALGRYEAQERALRRLRYRASQMGYTVRTHGELPGLTLGKRNRYGHLRCRGYFFDLDRANRFLDGIAQGMTTPEAQKFADES